LILKTLALCSIVPDQLQVFISEVVESISRDTIASHSLINKKDKSSEWKNDPH